jgi:iron complex outermembrane receptor protein
MKFLRILVLLCAVASCATAQQNKTSGIRGKITTSDGHEAPFVSVKLVGKPWGATTNVKGEYEIGKVKPGTYTVRVSAIGLTSQEKSVEVSESAFTELNFSLNENLSTLEEVNISANSKKYKADKPSSSLRLNEPLLEAPQNIQIVTSSAIADQQIISMSDGLIRNVSGAARLEHWGDMYTNINMRGSQIQAMRNGFNFVASYWGPLTEDMSIVDHIEFVKGPAGFMLGNGDPSGMYNVVTKKPTGVNRGEATLTAGSYDLYRATVDLDRIVSRDGKLLFRLNGAVQNKGSFRPFEKNNRYAVAPVISYEFSRNTKLTAEYDWQGAKMTEVGSYYIFSPEGYASLPRNFTLTQPGVGPTKINDHSVFVNLQHNFTDAWKATAQVAYSKYLQNGYSSWPSIINPDNTLIRNVGIWDAESTMKMAQLFINGKVKTGDVSHNILAGFDGAKKEYMADWGQSHDLDLPDDPFDLNNPDYGTPPNGFPDFDRETSLKDRAIAAGGLMDQKYLSGYLQDELGFFENKVRLTLAGRYTYVSQSAWGGSPDKAHHFTPRVGLSVSVTNNTAVYAVYDEAFIPQTGFLSSGKKIDPITGTNYEIGIKRDWFGGKWNTTLSAYRILKQNELTGDPANKAGENFSIVVGEKRAQGIEFDIKGEIIPGLDLTANYAYSDGKVTKVAEGVESMVVGQVVPGFSKHVSNAWLSYKIQRGKLKGTGFSSGFTHYAGRAMGTYSGEDAKQNLPNYFKLDAGLFWENNRIKVTGNAFNILNKYLYNGAYYTDYWNAPDYKQPVYSWQTEAPRSYRLSISYKF